MAEQKRDIVTLVAKNKSRLVGYIAKRTDRKFFHLDGQIALYSDYLQIYQIKDLKLPYVQLLPEDMRNRDVCVVFAEDEARYRQIVRDLGISNL